MDNMKDAIDCFKKFEKEYNKLVKQNEKIQSLENDVKIKNILHKQKIDSLNITIKHQNKKINELNKLIEKYETKEDMIIT